MKRDEEIRQEMSKIAGTHPDWSKNDCMRMGFLEGAKWADENPNSNGKELLYVVQRTAERTNKEIICKAEKWLENFLEKTIQKPSVNDGFTSDTIMCADYRRRKLIRDVLCDFKKAME